MNDVGSILVGYLKFGFEIFYQGILNSLLMQNGLDITKGIRNHNVQEFLSKKTFSISMIFALEIVLSKALPCMVLGRVKA